MHGVVNLLIKKLNISDFSNQLNFEKDVYVNTEELALAYIYIVIVVLFEYGNSNDQISKNNETFNFIEWIKEMQNSLTDFHRNLKGW
jgi:hypothetical protein